MTADNLGDSQLCKRNIAAVAMRLSIHVYPVCTTSGATIATWGVSVHVLGTACGSSGDGMAAGPSSCTSPVSSSAATGTYGSSLVPRLLTSGSGLSLLCDVSGMVCRGVVVAKPYHCCTTCAPLVLHCCIPDEAQQNVVHCRLALCHAHHTLFAQVVCEPRDSGRFQTAIDKLGIQGSQCFLFRLALMVDQVEQLKHHCLVAVW